MDHNQKILNMISRLATSDETSDINLEILGRELTTIYKPCKVENIGKGSFPLRAWKRAFFVCSIDFFALASILAASFNRRSIKKNKECSFPRS